MSTPLTNRSPVGQVTPQGTIAQAPGPYGTGSDSVQIQKGNQMAAQAAATGAPYTIAQPEPLFTVRPRSELYKTRDTSSGRRKGEVGRGPVSYLRIVPRGGVRRSKELSSDNSALDNVRNALISSDGYAEFMVAHVSAAFTEKVQVLQTFGDSETVYFFGRAPTNLTLNGMLFDDIDNQWFTRFIDAYNAYLRGTQLARNFELIELTLPNCRVVGTIISLSYSQAADRDTDIQFSLNILIKRYLPLSVEAEASTLLNGDLTQYNWVFPSDANAIGSGESAASLRSNQELTDPFDAVLRIPVDKPGRPKNALERYADGANNLAGRIISAAQKGRESFDKTMSPVDTLLTSFNQATAATTSVIRAIEMANSINLNTLSRPGNDLEFAKRQFKDMVGAIAALPETLSEQVARFTSKGGMGGTPTFAGGRNISPEEAVSALQTTNTRSDSLTPILEEDSPSVSGDDTAGLSF